MFYPRLSSVSNIVRVVMFVGLLGGAAVSANADDSEVNPPAVFSAANIVFGETLRVNIVNLGDSTVPPDPCNVAVTFVNTDGLTVKTSNISVDVGKIGWATVNFLEASQANGTAAAAPAQRQVLRPLITVIPPGPCRVVMSAEVYETASGRTSQFISPILLPAVAATLPAQ